MAETRLGSAPPRQVRVLDYVRERAEEVADLLAVIDNCSLPSGEVTKGPRTVMQRLPRHLRRRAMSYNVKRLPRSVRPPPTLTTESEQQVRRKAPSRFHKRRPSNLLQVAGVVAYIRRQRQQRWLETHIWHAKRFRMVSRFGYRMAERSCHRGFRASLREAARGCVVADVSYSHCLELSGLESILLKGLLLVFNSSAGKTVAHFGAKKGTHEVACWMFEANKYPTGLIGSVRVVWRPADGVGRRTVTFWAGPDISEAVFNCLVSVFNLEPINSDAAGIAEDPEDSLTKFQLKKSLAKFRSGRNLEAEQQRIECVLWTDSFARFRLVGPRSTAVLRSALRPPNLKKKSMFLEKNPWVIEETFAARVEQYRSTLSPSTPPAQMADGQLLNILVRDPRMFKPALKSMPPIGKGVDDLGVLEGPRFDSELWSESVRRRVLESKLPDGKLNQLRAKVISNSSEFDREVPNLIPVVVVVRNSTQNGLGAGFDVVLPAGWAMPFWVLFQYNGAKAVGLGVLRALAREQGAYFFPDDVPDCHAGRLVALQEKSELEKKFQMKPWNRRPNFDRLCFRDPFFTPWCSLFPNGSADNCDFYVLRERRKLAELAEQLRKGNCDFSEFSFQNANVLIPVQIAPLNRGVARRRCRLYLPNCDCDDISALKTDGGKIYEISAAEKREAKAVERAEQSEQPRLDSYIALSSGGDDVEQVSLASFFPDKDMERRELRKRKKREKRQKVKENKKKKKEAIDATAIIVKSGEHRLKEPSRRLIGFVVNGDYSLYLGRAKAMAYCSLEGLIELKKSSSSNDNNMILLFRNVGSNCYRASRVVVVTQP